MMSRFGEVELRYEVVITLSQYEQKLDLPDTRYRKRVFQLS
jgi:hypothetical protein